MSVAAKNPIPNDVNSHCPFLFENIPPYDSNFIPLKFEYIPLWKAIQNTFWSGVPGFVVGVAIPANVAFAPRLLIMLFSTF